MNYNQAAVLSSSDSEFLNRVSPDLRRRHHHHPDGGRHRHRVALGTTTSPLFIADSQEGYRDLLDNLRHRHDGSAADPVLDIMVPHRYVT